MNARLFILLTVLLGVVAGASASPVINVQTHYLPPETSAQAIAIAVSGADMVTGFNLRAQIGDGMGPGAEPVFDSVDFTGGLWDAYPHTTIGGVISGHEQYAQASVIFGNAGDAVAASGMVVTLLLDTTGFSEGSFDLLLSATDIGQDSDFIVFDGVSLTATITNGTITVSERVPGDTDDDRDVDDVDYGNLVAQFGGTPGVDSADFNGDNFVDLEDFAIQRGNFGFGVAPAPDSEFAVATTPEPATITVLALGVGGSALARRPRRRKPK